MFCSLSTMLIKTLSQFLMIKYPNKWINLYNYVSENWVTHPFNRCFYISVLVIDHFYQSVILISFSLSQSDHIKRLHCNKVYLSSSSGLSSLSRENVYLNVSALAVNYVNVSTAGSSAGTTSPAPGWIKLKKIKFKKLSSLQIKKEFLWELWQWLFQTQINS